MPSRSTRRVPGTSFALLLAGLAGCSGSPSAHPPGPTEVPTPATASTEVRLAFREQALPFRYDRGETGAAWPVEPTGGGVAMLDYDGDGRIDLFFAQGGPLQPGPDRRPTADVLLRNLGGGSFEDVSARAGLSPKGYGLGATVADYDGDGDPDVFVTRYGPDTLWRNDGGTFTDVTAATGVGCPLWGLGAAFLDYDRDGDLDLFVANYLGFDEKAAPFERDAMGMARQGPPAGFLGLPDALYRNNGDGTFTDVSTAAGIAANGRGMGCLAADFDGDGWLDVLVANDAEPNALWRNRRDGTFEDVASTYGLAVNAHGQVEANMGIARGDQDGDGLLDVVITHFWGEHVTLWRQERIADGAILFEDRTQEAGLAVDSLATTGWGVALADFDADGRLDLFTATGHIRPEPTQRYPYECPPLLWQGTASGRFVNASAAAGPYFQGLHMARGTAAGDLDDDGDLDLVVVHHEAPAVILWNESTRPGHPLILDLRPAGKGRIDIGTQVTAEVAGRTLVRSIDGGGGYVSGHDRRVHLGLGTAEAVDRIEIRWPDGTVESRAHVPVGGVLTWRQGKPPSEQDFSPFTAAPPTAPKAP